MDDSAKRLEEIEKRLNVIEGRLGIEPKKEITPAEESQKAWWHIETKKESKAPTVPVQITPEVAPAAQRVQPIEQGVEYKFGSRIFTGIGAVAVIFGIAFFLRYAFENNLITETMRVVLGLVGGAVLLGIGEFTRKNYPSYSQIVTGGGLGVLYLSLFAASNFYHLVSQPGVFMGMIVVTAMGVALAIHNNSQPLAGFAQLGGFLTPLLLSTGQNNSHSLFLYLVILNIGVLAIARWKLWRALTLGSLVGTVFLYFYWYVRFYTINQVWIAEGYATLFFIIFLFTTLLQYLLQRAPQDETDIILSTVNPALYFFTSYTLLNPHYHEWMGLFAAGLGSLYLLLSFFGRKSEEGSFRFQQIFAGIGFILLVLFVPIQFEKQWITIAWAAEALVLNYLGFQLQSKHLRALSHAVFILVFFRLLVLESDLSMGEQAWFNTRTFTYGVSLVFFLLASTLQYMRRSEVTEGEGKLAFSLSFVESYLLILWVVTAEINDFHPQWWLPIVWSLGALGGGWLGVFVGDLPLRFFSYATLFLASLRTLLFETTVNLSAYTPLFNTRVAAFVTVAVAMGVLAGVLKRSQDKIHKDEAKAVSGALAVGTNFLLLWVLSKEILDYYNQKLTAPALPPAFRAFTPQDIVGIANIKKVSLSVAWALYAIFLLILGIIKKSSEARIMALILFGIVIFKVFLYDTSNLNNFYRFVSFITLGLILLLTGYLYHRYRDRISQFIHAA